jgi:hypothetical protein
LVTTGIELGEAEAIALAEEHEGTLLIIDDRRGRDVADALHIKVTGTIGILLLAKSHGLISAVRPCLIRLRDENGFFVTDAVLEQATRLANE